MRVNVQRWVLGLGLILGFALQAVAADWEVLGERRVNDRADHDTIAVTGAAGMFTSVKFQVKEHAIRFYKIVVHFRNGGKEELEVKDVIEAGHETRNIDLPGRRRVIRSIDLWYESASLGHARSTIVAWGRH